VPHLWDLGFGEDYNGHSDNIEGAQFLDRLSNYGSAYPAS